MKDLDLEILREELDDIDNTIADMYVQRLTIIGDIAGYKASMQKPIFDAKREAEVIASAVSFAETREDKEAVEELFRFILEASRKRQEKLMKQ